MSELLETMAWRSLSDDQLIEKIASMVRVSDRRDIRSHVLRQIMAIRAKFTDEPGPLYSGYDAEIKNRIANVMRSAGLPVRPKIVDQVIRRIRRCRRFQT